MPPFNNIVSDKVQPKQVSSAELAVSHIVYPPFDLCSTAVQ